MSQPPGTKPRPPAPSAPTTSPMFWEFADLGFDTGKKLWFIQFYDETNKSVGSYFARNIIAVKGFGGTVRVEGYPG